MDSIQALRLAGAICALGAFATSAHSDAAPSARTAAAIVAADNAWTEAEIHGDAAFVDALLLPEYRSIGTDGKVASKAAIVASAKARGAHSDFGAQVAAYRKDHPTRADVVIVGDTAVLSWVSLVHGKGEPIASSDIFVYREGRWRALYSQHSTAES